MNHGLATAAAAAVFDSGSAAIFLPDSPHAPHRIALHSYMASPVEALPIKNVTSHVDSGQTAHVIAPLLRLYRSSETSGRQSKSPFWRHKLHSFFFYISRRWHQKWDTCVSFTVVNQSEARISNGNHIYVYTYFMLKTTVNNAKERF